MIQKSSRYQIDKWTTPPEYQLEKKLWDGTNIQVSQRVGDEERMWVRDKLTRLHVAGFLALAEYQARDSAAEVAVTRESLNRLISDLPAHEDDWRGVRKIPLGSYPAMTGQSAEREVLIATTASKRHPENLFPLFIVLGIFAFLGGAIGLDAHTTPAMATYAGVAVVMGLVSIWAGLILARMT